MPIVIKITHYDMNQHNVRLTDNEIEDIMHGLRLLTITLTGYLQDTTDLSKIKGLEGQVQEIKALLSRLDTIYG